MTKTKEKQIGLKKENVGDVSISVIETDAMFLKQHLGDGSLGKTKFSACVALPTMSFLIDIEDKTYLVESQKIISAVVDLHELNKKKK